MVKNGTNGGSAKIIYPLLIISALIGGISFRVFIDFFLRFWFKGALSVQEVHYSVQTLPLNDFDYPLLFSPNRKIPIGLVRYLYVNL